MTQAYYRVYRQPTAEAKDCDGAATRLFSRLQLPNEVFEEFAKALEQRHTYEDREDKQFQAAMAEELMCGTWFCMKRDGRPSMTQRGSRPGDTVADILFSFALSRLLQQITAVLKAEDILTIIPWSGTRYSTAPTEPRTNIELLGPTWADDLCVLTSATDPQAILRKLHRMTVVIARHLSVAGLEVNFKRGKTEACIQLYGSNAKETKRELYRHTQLGIDIPELKAFLRVVPA